LEEWFSLTEQVAGVVRDGELSGSDDVASDALHSRREHIAARQAAAEARTWSRTGLCSDVTAAP